MPSKLEEQIIALERKKKILGVIEKNAQIFTQANYVSGSYKKEPMQLGELSDNPSIRRVQELELEVENGVREFGLSNSEAILSNFDFKEFEAYRKIRNDLNSSHSKIINQLESTKTQGYMSVDVYVELTDSYNLKTLIVGCVSATIFAFLNSVIEGRGLPSGIELAIWNGVCLTITYVVTHRFDDNLGKNHVSSTDYENKISYEVSMKDAKEIIRCALINREPKIGNDNKYAINIDYGAIRKVKDFINYRYVHSELQENLTVFKEPFDVISRQYAWKYEKITEVLGTCLFVK